MSDYLGNLLKRSFVPAAEIRPRLAGRFEPSGISNPGNIASDLPHEIESRSESPGPRRRPPSTQSAPAATPSRGSAADESENPNSETPSAALLSEAGFHDQPLAQPNASQSFPRPGDLRVSARVSVDTSRAAPASVPFAPAEPGALPSGRAKPAASDQPLERSAAATGSLSDPAPRANSFTPTEDTEAAPSHPIGRTRESDLALTRPPSRRERGASTAPSSSPTIQITIGRVEVRAASIPAVTRPAPGKGPELTLDAYLRRRAEGGRR